MAIQHVPTDLRLVKVVELSAVISWDLDNTVEYANGVLREDVYYNVYTSVNGTDYTLYSRIRQKTEELPLLHTPFFVKISSGSPDCAESAKCAALTVSQTIDTTPTGGLVVSWANVEKSDAEIQDLDVPAYSGNALKLLQVNAGGTAVAWTPIVWSASNHAHADTYEPLNTNIQSHIAAVTGNPHAVTLTDVGGAAAVHTHPYEAANANIQSHISAVTGNPHAVSLSDVGAEAANANIQSHISAVTGNPHAVTLAEVGGAAAVHGHTSLANNLQFTNIGEGPQLKSADGSFWTLVVDNAGVVTSVKVV